MGGDYLTVKDSDGRRLATDHHKQRYRTIRKC